jgi:hypothetical protein
MKRTLMYLINTRTAHTVRIRSAITMSICIYRIKGWQYSNHFEILDLKTPIQLSISSAFIWFELWTAFSKFKQNVIAPTVQLTVIPFHLFFQTNWLKYGLQHSPILSETIFYSLVTHGADLKLIYLRFNLAIFVSSTKTMRCLAKLLMVSIASRHFNKLG